MLPASRVSRPARSRSRVVLPVPFAPTIPTRSLGVTSQSKSSNRVLRPNRFAAPVTWIMMLSKFLEQDDILAHQAGPQSCANACQVRSLRNMAHNLSRSRAGQPAFLDHRLAVHEHQVESFGKLMWFHEC